MDYLSQKGGMKLVSEICGKIIYRTKKDAKKASEHLSRSKFGAGGAKYSFYHCKSCNAWHIFTKNKKKLKSNKQHARGRGYNRRKKMLVGGRRR